jgi:hypothetical protein
VFRQVDSHTGMNRWKLTVVIFVVGVALGLLTRVADNQENALSWLGSLAAPWVLTAFAVGALSRRLVHGVAVGAITLTLAVGVYYAYMRVFEGGVTLSYFLSITMLWLLLAPIAGGAFGLCGALWGEGRSHWLIRPVAVATVAGLVAGESAFMLSSAREISTGDGVMLGGLILLGLTLPWLLLRTKRELIAGYVVSGFCLLLGVATVPLIRNLVVMLE